MVEAVPTITSFPDYDFTFNKLALERRQIEYIGQREAA